MLADGRLEPAEQAARALLRAVEATPDSERVADVADVMDLLVEVLSRQRRADATEAIDLARRVVRVREGRSASPDPALAKSLRNLANLLVDHQEFSEAMPLLGRALDILEQAYGADDLRVAPCHTDIAIAHSIRGSYEKAVSSYERALSIQEAAAQADELQLAKTLNGLGIVLYEIGDYVGSKARHQQALEIRERLLSPDHVKVAESLNNRAMVLVEMLDFHNALADFSRAVEIRQQVYGPRHRLVGRVLSNRSNVELQTGNPTRARETAEQALRIFEKHGDSWSRAACLGILGAAYQELGRHEKARGCFEQARETREESVDPYLMITFEALARLNFETGDLEESLRFSTRALALCESLLTLEHPLIATYEALRATVMAQGGDVAGAFSAASRAEGIRSKHLRLTSKAVSEREALLYSRAPERGIDVLLRLSTSGARLPQNANHRIWEALIQSRALVLDEMVARSRAAALSRDPKVEHLFDELRRMTRRYANLALRGGRGMPPEIYRDLMVTTRQAKERAERQLADASMAFRTESARAAIGLGEIASQLPSASALIAYAAFDDPLVPQHAPLDEASRQPRRFAALVLRSGEDTPQIVSLGTASHVDTLVNAWGSEVARGGADSWRTAAEAEAECTRAGEALRAAIWDPVAELLSGASLVFVVPDASLYRVSFAALPRPSGGYLDDSGVRFHYLAAERDLVPSNDERPRGRGLLALGGVDFDASATRVAAPGRGARARTGRTTTLRAVPCDEFADVPFAALPGSMQEVREIAALWQQSAASKPGQSGADEVRVLSGAEATDSAFKSLATGKWWLHAATHGFVLDEGCAAVAPEDPPERAKRTRGSFEPRPNPLQLAGLVFSGVNATRSASDWEDDGLLIAEEIAALDLQGVQGAVLSACESGIGRVLTGEGVLGLRRAFQVAGAQTLIMSLWAVADVPTLDWMRALYTARLKRGLGIADAVHQANQDMLEARRERGKSCDPCDLCSTHPFYWASFVAAGDWR
jgi:CHAT domain-containing protein/Tfp pilus assembly protein PilF